MWKTTVDSVACAGILKDTHERIFLMKSSPATKHDLKSSEKRVLATTRQDLKTALHESETRILATTHTELEQSRQDLRQEMRGMRDELRTEIREATHEIIDVLKTFAESVDRRFDDHEIRITRIEATMVTKDYLDIKMAQMRGELISIIGVEDKKVNSLIRKLKKPNAISAQEARELLDMRFVPSIPL